MKARTVTLVVGDFNEFLQAKEEHGWLDESHRHADNKFAYTALSWDHVDVKLLNSYRESPVWEDPYFRDLHTWVAKREFRDD